MDAEITAVLEKACSTPHGKLKAQLALTALGSVMPALEQDATRPQAEAFLQKWADGADDLKKGLATTLLAQARARVAGHVSQAAEAAIAGAHAARGAYGKAAGKAGNLGAAAGEAFARSPLNAGRMAAAQAEGGAAAKARMAERFQPRGARPTSFDAAGGPRRVEPFLEHTDAVAPRDMPESGHAGPQMLPAQPGAPRHVDVGWNPAPQPGSGATGAAAVQADALAEAHRIGAANAANAHAGQMARMGRKVARRAFHAGMLAGAAGVTAASLGHLTAAQRRQRSEAGKHSHQGRGRQAGVEQLHADVEKHPHLRTQLDADLAQRPTAGQHAQLAQMEAEMAHRRSARVEKATTVGELMKGAVANFLFHPIDRVSGRIGERIGGKLAHAPWNATKLATRKAARVKSARELTNALVPPFVEPAHLHHEAMRLATEAGELRGERDHILAHMDRGRAVAISAGRVAATGGAAAGSIYALNQTPYGKRKQAEFRANMEGRISEAQRRQRSEAGKHSHDRHAGIEKATTVGELMKGFNPIPAAITGAAFGGMIMPSGFVGGALGAGAAHVFNRKAIRAAGNAGSSAAFEAATGGSGRIIDKSHYSAASAGAKVGRTANGPFDAMHRGRKAGEATAVRPWVKRGQLAGGLVGTVGGAAGFVAGAHTEHVNEQATREKRRLSAAERRQRSEAGKHSHQGTGVEKALTVRDLAKNWLDAAAGSAWTSGLPGLGGIGGAWGSYTSKATSDHRTARTVGSFIGGTVAGIPGAALGDAIGGKVGGWLGGSDTPKPVATGLKPPHTPKAGVAPHVARLAARNAAKAPRVPAVPKIGG